MLFSASVVTFQFQPVWLWLVRSLRLSNASKTLATTLWRAHGLEKAFFESCRNRRPCPGDSSSSSAGTASQPSDAYFFFGVRASDLLACARNSPDSDLSVFLKRRTARFCKIHILLFRLTSRRSSMFSGWQNVPLPSCGVAEKPNRVCLRARRQFTAWFHVLRRYNFISDNVLHPSRRW